MKAKVVKFQMRIAMCEDDTIELEKCRKAVEEFIIPNQAEQIITVDTFTNGNDLLDYIAKHGGFDLLILDIIMPSMNGIELATGIRQTNKDCKIIFLTSSPEFAVNSYKVNAFYYQLKPFSSAEFKSLLSKALDEMGEEKLNSILVKEKGKFTRIQIHTIQYVESMKHIILFHLRNNVVISCYGTLNEFNDILLSDKRFIKCHKSFIINMNYVTSISNKDFMLDNKILIPIPKQVYQQVKNAYFEYFFNKQKGF
jgi:DNA-binding LytR/AlgR family response regulator